MSRGGFTALGFFREKNEKIGLFKLYTELSFVSARVKSRYRAVHSNIRCIQRKCTITRVLGAYSLTAHKIQNVETKRCFSIKLNCYDITYGRA